MVVNKGMGKRRLKEPDFFMTLRHLGDNQQLSWEKIKKEDDFATGKGNTGNCTCHSSESTERESAERRP